MLAAYETIDLGFVTMLSNASASGGDSTLLELLEDNHPVLLLDPIHNDAVYVYHAFGVHALQLGRLLRSLALAIHNDAGGGDDMEASLQNCKGTEVQSLFSTYSIEKK